MRTDELVEVSQDREAWRELVVACFDPQPPDWRETRVVLSSKKLPGQLITRVSVPGYTTAALIIIIIIIMQLL